MSLLPIPKPYSERTIQHMLEGWNPATADLLHKVYSSLANLYGIINLEAAWDIIKAVGVKLRKRDLIEFSSIARYENTCYYIFEADELFECDKCADKDRFIVHRAHFPRPYCNAYSIYDLYYAQEEKPVYIPDDLLSFAECDGVSKNPHWKELCKLIGDLKDKTGKKLTESYYLSDSEKMLIDYYKSETRRRKVAEAYNRPLSDRLLESLRFNILMGYDFDGSLIRYINDEKIMICKKDAKRLTELLMHVNNESNLWVNFGWSPSELVRHMPRSPIKEISMGGGMKKALADGDIDVAQLKKELAKMGIKLVED